MSLLNPERLLNNSNYYDASKDGIQVCFLRMRFRAHFEYHTVANLPEVEKPF